MKPAGGYEMGEIKTRTGTASLDVDGIVRFTCFPKAELNLTDAKNNTEG